MFTTRIHSFPASPTDHLFIGEGINNATSVEHWRPDDYSPGWQVDSGAEGRRGNQYPQGSLAKCTLYDVPLIKSQA